MATTKTIVATYSKKKGFICGNHVLYCPDLKKADNARPFYLYCPTHHLMHQIDLLTQSAEFIAEFPSGCRATT